MNGFNTLINKVPERLAHSFHPVRTRQEVGSLTCKRAFTRTWPHWYHDLRLPSFITTNDTFLSFMSMVFLSEKPKQTKEKR